MNDFTEMTKVYPDGRTGNYYCLCSICQQQFIGHKRDDICHRHEAVKQEKEKSPYVPRHIRQHIEQTVWVDDAADALIEMGVYCVDNTKPEDFHHVRKIVARLMRASNMDEGGELMEIDAAKFMREYIRNVITEVIEE